MYTDFLFPSCGDILVCLSVCLSDPQYLFLSVGLSVTFPSSLFAQVSVFLIPDRQATFFISIHGPSIYKGNKPQWSAFLKNWPVKVLGGRCLLHIE
jgi:hypothetical protein